MTKKTFCIPASFTLGGRTWSVRMAEQTSATETTKLGHSVYDLAEITIYKQIAGHALPIDAKQKTFVHELLHAVLDDAYYRELSNDEAFVDRIASGLYQALTSQEGSAQ